MSLFMYVFSLFVVRKEVKKKEAEEKIKSTGKKRVQRIANMEGNSKLLYDLFVELKCFML